MTLKKQIYFSNIRLIVITIISLMLIPLLIRVAIYFKDDLFSVAGTGVPDLDAFPPAPERHRPPEPPLLFGFVPLAFFVILMSVANSLLTFRMVKNIVRPLQSLSEGVRQIQKYNLAYRIDYKNKDEFRPVCDAFNEMSAYLETAAIEKEKNETNRRELIAGISHDLRTPLTSIKGYLEGLETGVASTPEMRSKYFNTIKTKTADLEHIIEQLFLFSKLDMNEFPLTLRRTAIIPLVEDMVQECAAEYSSRGLDIELNGIANGPREIVVPVDAMWLRNVIFNILENSIIYKTKERARMEISAAIFDGTINVRFADDGPGVAPGALEKLFSAFYRNDPARNKKGSGLGLAISAKIIERMGGSCRAELPASGGLAIVISLPTVKDASQ
jgi:signal transduction histidine kinase